MSRNAQQVAIFLFRLPSILDVRLRAADSDDWAGLNHSCFSAKEERRDRSIFSKSLDRALRILIGRKLEGLE